MDILTRKDIKKFWGGITKLIRKDSAVKNHSRDTEYHAGNIFEEGRSRGYSESEIESLLLDEFPSQIFYLSAEHLLENYIEELDDDHIQDVLGWEDWPYVSEGDLPYVTEDVVNDAANRLRENVDYLIDMVYFMENLEGPTLDSKEIGKFLTGMERLIRKNSSVRKLLKQSDKLFGKVFDAIRKNGLDEDEMLGRIDDYFSMSFNRFGFGGFQHGEQVIDDFVIQYLEDTTGFENLMRIDLEDVGRGDLEDMEAGVLDRMREIMSDNIVDLKSVIDYVNDYSG